MVARMALHSAARPLRLRIGALSTGPLFKIVTGRRYSPLLILTKGAGSAEMVFLVVLGDRNDFRNSL